MVREVDEELARLGQLVQLGLTGRPEHLLRRAHRLHLGPFPPQIGVFKDPAKKRLPPAESFFGIVKP